ncbi:GntR family transcriptional regulator [Sphaerisporangium sp. NPDC005288]|uniref:GntR family transcriptional regulator n=1 Tax=Sphaerisporangium sp. NPDC005288 TaxID=3155114 RepID=UPI00339F9729
MADTPLWEGLYLELRRQIESGDLAPGAPVPRELQLADQHSLSRTTVRQALAKLQADGLITRGQGRLGRTVREQRPLEWNLVRFERGERRDDAATGMDDWAAAVAEQGRTPRQEVRVTIEAPPADVCMALELADGEMAVRRARIRYVDNVPYQLSTSWFPENLARDTVLMQQADVAVPGGILRHIGSPQVAIRDRIIIRMPSPAEADQLDIPNGTPVGEHQRTGYGEDGQPVRYMVTVFAGDKHFLVYELEI